LGRSVTTAHDFDWWDARIEAARVESTTPGKRSFLGWCPVHGGSDSLHVTEKGTKTLVKCFGCEATYDEIVAAIEGIEATPIKITRTTRRASSRKVVPSDAKADPLAWYAAYCGVAREILDGLPLAATPDGWIAHAFGTLSVVKLRQAGTDERRWDPAGAHTPAIWPLEDTMPREVLLTEGETDAIALRGLGYDMAYSAGSSSGVPSVADFRSIARRGVQTVFVAYDADEPGQKGAEKAMENAMAAGLSAARIVPPDYDSLTGSGKDWREWALAGNDEVPESNLGQVIKTVATIRAETPSSVPWAAYPVAYFGGVSVLAGPPKGGKSTLLGHLTRCAETGERFLGEYDMKQGTPVLLMTEEHGIPVVMKMDAFGLSTMDVVQRGDAVRAGWGLADSLAAAARWITSNPRGVIVVDTLAVWAGIENENDAGETTAAVETIRHALADRGAAVILVHHTRKGGGIAGEATRGSGAIAAACDVQAELTYVNPEDPTDSRRRLTVRGRVMETLSLIVSYDTASHSYAVEDTAEERNAELVAFIEPIPRDGAGMSRAELEAAWGIAAGGRRIKQLLGLGLLRKSDDLVRTGRTSGWVYWRADPTVNFDGRTVEQRSSDAALDRVESESGATAAKAVPTHEARSNGRTTGIGRSSVRPSEVE
jgi:hypothetical protein